jgi:hypothetical protein
MVTANEVFLQQLLVALLGRQYTGYGTGKQPPSQTEVTALQVFLLSPWK